MIQEKSQEANLNFTVVLDFVNKYRWIILAAIGLAIIASIIFSSSFFIIPLYKSSVILYPSTTNSISHAILSTGSFEKQDVLAFGEEEEAEQLLQLLQSDEITEKVIKKYRLKDHYGFDADTRYLETKLGQKFRKRVNYKRTEYMSIEISVLDQDPVIAANMANDILHLLDSAKYNIQSTRAKEALVIVEETYNQKLASINLMVDSLQVLGEMGVPPFSLQSSGVESEYYSALARGSGKNMTELKRVFELRSKYSPVQKSFLDKIEYENRELSLLKNKLEEAKTDAEKFLRATFTVNTAKPSEIKEYPRRSIIVLISALATFAMSILVLAAYDNYNRFIDKRHKATKITNTYVTNDTRSESYVKL
ncbi:MAG: Wzz/FepE/Etk N-terminal domain-containing protein [Bacteroidota bacterium]|nr:Wzz/FepE/Etk N-terminal domain-containing protein [Bacteroidota bacterium]